MMVYLSLDNSTVGDSYDAKIVNGTSYVAIKAVTDQLGYRAVWNGSTRTVNITKEGINNIDITTATLKPTKTNSYTETNISYPVISGLDNAEAEVAINKAFKAHAQTYLEQTQKQAKELGAPPKDSAIQYEMDSGYKITYNRNGVLSVVVTDYEYLGGAHGGSTQTGMTFSLKDGKQIQLSDLLKSNSNYRKDIDKIINTQMNKNKDLYFADSFKGIAANQGYYLTDSGITLYFQQYDLAPYAAGMPEFPITFKQVLPSGVNPLDAYKA